MIYILLTIFIIVCLYLSIKLIILNKTIKEIENKLPFILNNNTNQLITISSNNKNFKKLVNNLNKDLKYLRKLKLEYINGNQNLVNVITNMTHDIRTPLTAIRGYLDLLETNNLNKKQKEYIKYINTKVNDLTILTEELFDYSKISNNSLDKENVCLNDELENIIASFYDLFKEKGINPSITITNKKIIRYINKLSFNRIIDNIIMNALKYSDEYINIKLDDNGIITFKNKTTILDRTSVAKIFDRFFTVENANKSSGIGLSIARNLVELNNGKITAKLNNNELVITIVFNTI